MAVFLFIAKNIGNFVNGTKAVLDLSKEFAVNLTIKLKKLQELGVVVLKGQLKLAKYETKGYALVYKGEVIAEGTVKDLIREVFDIWKKAGKQANLSKYLDLTADNIKKYGLFGGKILSESEIARHATELLKRFGTKIKKVDGVADEGVEARFIAELNTIQYKEGATEYLIAHESFHAEEMNKIGFNKYVENAPAKGIKEEFYTKESLIRRYYRERYVYQSLLQNTKKYDLNSQEIWHIKAYFYEIEFSLLEKKIKIPK